MSEASHEKQIENITIAQVIINKGLRRKVSRTCKGHKDQKIMSQENSKPGICETNAAHRRHRFVIKMYFICSFHCLTNENCRY